jgi:hypothetical protein
MGRFRIGAELPALAAEHITAYFNLDVPIVDPGEVILEDGRILHEAGRVLPEQVTSDKTLDIIQDH